MFIQLIAIGYCLKYIFNNDHPAIILLVLAVMITIAGYIAPRPLKKKQFSHTDLLLPELDDFTLGDAFQGHCLS
jgi:ABC-type iron transport system FetAB permease component